MADEEKFFTRIVVINQIGEYESEAKHFTREEIKQLSDGIKGHLCELSYLNFNDDFGDEVIIGGDLLRQSVISIEVNEEEDTDEMFEELEDIEESGA